MADRLVRSVRGFVSIGGVETVLSIAVLAFALWPGQRALVLVIALISAVSIATALGASQSRRQLDDFAPLARFRMLRAIAAASILAFEPRSAALACVLILLGILIEEPTRLSLIAAPPLCANLPGVELRNTAPFPPRWLYFSNLAALAAATAILLGFESAAYAASALGAITIVGALVLLGDSTARRKRSAIVEAGLPRALAAYGPEFVVYWDAARGTGYQLRMWIAQLEELGAPFIIVLRERGSFEDALEITSRPVLLRLSHSDLDALLVPSLRVAFYVNNATRNANFTRFAQLRHVQLNHGESDKAPSYSPSMRMYDHDFVAGPAAVARFTDRAVTTTADFFRIVGRPQLAPISQSAPHPGPRRVLYAPTWAGFNADTAHSSLLFGERIVAELLRHDDIEVDFRPHPHTDHVRWTRHAAARIRRCLEQDRARTGRNHRFSRSFGTSDLYLTFNEVDAVVADVSSVIADFLASGKPFAVTETGLPATPSVKGPAIESAGYTIRDSDDSIRNGVAALLGTDPASANRAEVRRYFLGFDDPAESVAAFRSAARSVLDLPKRA
ncbi:glycosyl transferase [Agromyces lapidis]|uniref:Glycosyl transferase n=1 Tax=Agromyces lapidis TaxID=279574 RepID=A0ABV5SR69_9MICO|nr:glycosyl transferase [Agromyces lapidis]